MPEKETYALGTPIVCKECGFEDVARLRKFTKISDFYCGGCHRQGTMIRNTDYDKARRRKKNTP